jgi:protein-L-isoaspartate O-methyltransferase
MPAHEDAIKAKRISALILANIAQGMDAEAAYDAVLGAGAFKAMAGELYDELRAKG